MHFLHGAKRSLDLARRACGDAPAVTILGHVRTDLDIEVAHHLMEYLAARNRPVVHVNHARDALERRMVLGLRRHRVEQKTQCRAGILAIHAAIFLIGRAATVIDRAEEHQGRRTAIFANP